MSHHRNIIDMGKVYYCPEPEQWLVVEAYFVPVVMNALVEAESM